MRHGADPRRQRRNDADSQYRRHHDEYRRQTGSPFTPALQPGRRTVGAPAAGSSRPGNRLAGGRFRRCFAVAQRLAFTGGGPRAVPHPVQCRQHIAAGRLHPAGGTCARQADSRRPACETDEPAGRFGTRLDQRNGPLPGTGKPGALHETRRRTDSAREDLLRRSQCGQRTGTVPAGPPTLGRGTNRIQATRTTARTAHAAGAEPGGAPARAGDEPVAHATAGRHMAQRHGSAGDPAQKRAQHLVHPTDAGRPGRLLRRSSRKPISSRTTT